MDNKVFISHSSNDFILASAICTELESKGMECWIAPRDIPSGYDYASAIMEGIRTCNTFLVLISENSDRSGAVMNEVECATRFQKKLKAVLVGDHTYSDFFGYHFNRIQMVKIPNEPSSSEINKVASELFSDNQLVVNTARIARDISNPITHNLPAKPQMIGRQKEFERALASLNAQSQILNISGMPGIGKKTLANVIGHYYVENDIYDMIIWLNAENVNLKLDDIIDQMALISGDQYLIRLQDKEKELAAMSLLQSKSCIFIINGFDYINDEAPLKFINKINFDDAVILTSETPIYDFDSVERIRINGLSTDETYELALLEASRIGLSGLETAPRSMFANLGRYTSGNPHAIKLAIGQIKSGMPFDRVLIGLSKAKGRIFDDIYSKSWSVLSNQSKAILFSQSCFSNSSPLAGLQFVCGLDEWDFMEAIQSLTDASLIESNNAFDSSKIRFHILTITDSYIQSKKQDYPEYEQYVERFINYFVIYIEKNHQDYTKIVVELDNIKKVSSELKTRNILLYCKVLQLLYGFKRDTGFWDEAIEEYEYAIKTLEERPIAAAPPLLLSELKTQLSSFYLRQGTLKDLARAEELLNFALTDFRSHNNRLGETFVLGRMGRIKLKKREYSEALELSLSALKIAKEIGHIGSIPDLEHEIGDEYYKLGNFDEAEKYYQSSLDAYAAQDNKIRIIGRYQDLGKLYLQKRDTMKARFYLEKSIELAETHNKLDTLCKAQLAFGELCILEGKMDKASIAIKKGLELANKLKAFNETNKAKELLSSIITL